MPHSICAVVFAGPPRLEVVAAFETDFVALECNLTMVWIDHRWSEHWQIVLGHEGYLALPPSIRHAALLPTERVVHEFATRLIGTPTRFAVVWTDYFGGVGEQRGVAYEHAVPLDCDGTINSALRQLGVVAQAGMDEFDTVGLARHRSIPNHVLERWDQYDH